MKPSFPWRDNTLFRFEKCEFLFYFFSRKFFERKGTNAHMFVPFLFYMDNIVLYNVLKFALHNVLALKNNVGLISFSYFFTLIEACLVKRNMRGYSNEKYLSILNIECGIEMKTICKGFSELPFISSSQLKSLRLTTWAFFIEKYINIIL